MATPKLNKIRPLTTVTTYSLAHTAQCKLRISANRGDRDLRFVLGHAFTLDNIMLRIVEIENQSAKSTFVEGKAPSEDGTAHFDCTNPVPVPEPEEHFDCTKPAPTLAEPEPRGRRISFQDNNARPSNTTGLGSHPVSSPARKRSPPPVSLSANRDYVDDDDSDGTSSDDYDELESYNFKADEPEAKPPKQRPVHDAYSDEENAVLEFADDELDPLGEDMGGLSLTRFESASAQPPRMIRSDSSSSEEDNGPVSPPQLPADVDVREILEGEKDEDLANLYDNVRRCACHGQRDDEELSAKPQGFWDVPMEKSGGKRLAVVAMAA